MTYDQPGNNSAMSLWICDFNEKLAPARTSKLLDIQHINPLASCIFYTTVEILLPGILNLIYIHQIVAKEFTRDIADRYS